MRLWSCCLAVILLTACEQETTSRNPAPAAWNGSLGILVVDGSRQQDVSFALQEGALQGDGDMSINPSDDGRFDQALKLTTSRMPASFADLEASLANQRPIQRGAPCWLHLNGRATQPQSETGLARLEVSFRDARIARRRSFAHRIYLPPIWTSIDIPFEAHADIEAGGAHLAFGVGTQPQAIEIANFGIRCFDLDTSLADLPSSSFSYAGREPDANWRAAATARIERYRKGDLLIEVQDADGQPVPGANIAVQMTDHAFRFGSTADAELLSGISPGGGQSAYGTEDTATYRRMLAELFNTASLDNGMDWIPWSDKSQRRITENALAWIESLGLDLRGSDLISPGWSEIPRALSQRQGDGLAMRNAVNARIEEMVGGFGDRVHDWDVLSEPREHHDLIDLLGEEAIDAWFRTARSAAPDPKLLVNESEALSGDHLPTLMALVGNLLNRNVPVDGIGLESHVSLQPPPLDVLSDRLDQLARLNLPLLITAFSAAIPDETLQADFTRDLMTLVFSHPAVEGLIIDGLWAGRQQNPDEAMYREDWTIKPNGEAYRELVLDAWWTDLNGTGSAEGILVTRGFLGDYRVRAEKDGRLVTAQVTLDLDGTSIVLTLPN